MYLMFDIFRMIFISFIGFTVGINTALETFSSIFAGFVVSLLTIIFLIFQIQKIRLEIQAKKIDIKNKKAKSHDKGESN